MMAVFRILLPNLFYGFSGFAKEVTPCSHAKTIILRDHLPSEECMTSLVSLAAIIWVVMPSLSEQSLVDSNKFRSGYC